MIFSPYASLVLKEEEKMKKFEEVSKMDLSEKLKRDRQEWTQWLTKYQARLKEDKGDAAQRVELMNKNNPSFILRYYYPIQMLNRFRNWILQLAIEKAEQLDFSLVNKLLEIIRKPYEVVPETKEFEVQKPLWAHKLCISCSS